MSVKEKVAIVDRNGKQTHVWKLPSLAAQNPRYTTLPSKPGGNPRLTFGEGVLTQTEIDRIGDHQAYFITQLAQATGFDIYALAFNDENITSPVLTDKDDYYALSLKMPDGRFVDHNGIYTEAEFREAEAYSETLDRLVKVDDYKLIGKKVFYQSGTDVSVSKVYRELFGKDLIDWYTDLDDTDKIVFDGKEYPLLIDGYSSFACPQCGAFFSEEQEADSWMDNHEMTCMNCGVMSNLHDTIAAINPDQLKYLEDDVVRESTWFHSTIRDDWHRVVTEDYDDGKAPAVHLGDEKAARERAMTVGSTYHLDNTMYIYEVRLKAGVDMSPHLAKDENNAPETLDDLKRNKEYSATGVSRYLNLYENAGSISLLANPNCFEVVSVTEIQS